MLITTCGDSMGGLPLVYAYESYVIPHLLRDLLRVVDTGHIPLMVTVARMFLQTQARFLV